MPFYVTLSSPPIDFSISDGLRQIPIEQRGADEVATVTGRTAEGKIETVRIVPDGSPVTNYAFDVTPARLVSGLITERRVLKADRGGTRQRISGAAKLNIKFLATNWRLDISTQIGFVLQKKTRPLIIAVSD